MTTGSVERHARHELSELVHQPVRFSILAALFHAERVDFTFLQMHLDLTESNLSRHLSALEEAKLIAIDKVFERKRARTWLSLTKRGRSAFEAHVDALRRIVGSKAASPTRKGIQAPSF